MDNEEYETLENEYKALSEKHPRNEDDDDRLSEIAQELINHNSFTNTLDREIAEEIIDCEQKLSLGLHGGYPLYDEAYFWADGYPYAVIVYGASNENEGEDALFGMVFVRGDKVWIPKVGVKKSRLDFARFNRYLAEVRKGEREANGMDEYGDVPYICEECKLASAVLLGKKKLCNECGKKSRSEGSQE